MDFSVVQRAIGFLIAGSSLMMMLPVLVSWWYHDGTGNLFQINAAILLLIGWRSAFVSACFHDPELKVYLSLQFIFSFLVSAKLHLGRTHTHFSNTWRSVPRNEYH